MGAEESAENLKNCWIKDETGGQEKVRKWGRSGLTEENKRGVTTPWQTA